MSFIARITVFCFAASYSVVLLLEISRLFFRSGVRGALMIGFAAAGLLAHTLYLGHRAAIASGAPLSSAFDWYLLAAWAMMAAYLYLTWYYPRSSVGLFLLPLVLGLILLAKFADRTPFPQSSAGQVWGAIHGVFLLLGLVAVALGFVAGVMYLIQSYRLKHKMPSASGVRLPSLEWLERVSSRAILVSVLMVGIGFASGVVLNMVLQRRKLDELPWSDPIIWRTGLMFGWLLVAAVFSKIYRPARSGRKVAYLTVANFVFLAVSLGIGVLVPSEHGAAADRQKAGIEGGDAEIQFRLKIAECRLQSLKGGIRKAEFGRGEFQYRFQIADFRMQIDWRQNAAAIKFRLADDRPICTLHSAFFILQSPSAFRLPTSAFAPPEASA